MHSYTTPITKMCWHLQLTIITNTLWNTGKIANKWIIYDLELLQEHLFVTYVHKEELPLVRKVLYCVFCKKCKNMTFCKQQDIVYEFFHKFFTSTKLTSKSKVRNRGNRGNTFFKHSRLSEIFLSTFLSTFSVEVLSTGCVQVYTFYIYK